jgi:hypothetical protein
MVGDAINMMKNTYLRTVLFSGLKSSVYSVLLLATGWIVTDRMSPIAYSIVFCCVYTVLTFIFAELIFSGQKIHFLHLTGILVLGYIVDALVSISFFSWYYERNMFLEQSFASLWIFIVLYLVSTVGAYLLKKRMSAMRGLSEGLA